MENGYSLKKLLSEMKKTRQNVKKELRNYSDANLMISKNRERIEYFEVRYVEGRRRRRSIAGNIGLVYRLAHKAYLEELMRRLDCNIARLEATGSAILPTDETDILRSLPKNYQRLNPSYIIRPELLRSDAVPHPSGDVPPVPLSVSAEQMLREYAENDHKRAAERKNDLSLPEIWLSVPYAENTSFPEHKTIIACSGLRMRSKSEALILQRYEEKGIPYHYDETVTVMGNPVSPDFIALRRDGSVFIHEHAGLWSDDYLRRNERKLHIYRQAGFVQGKNLLITFDDEDGNINLALIDALLDDIVGKRVL